MPEREADRAAFLAHEINNPLDTVQNLVHFLESETTLSDKGREYLALIKQELGRMTEITHRTMHEFRTRPNFQSTDVPALFRSVVNFYQSRLKARGISVFGHYCERGELSVSPSLLRQMFTNLLLNAADAMPEGGKVSARISAVQEWSAPRRHGLRVTIGDNGSGITRDVLPKITDPFFTTKGISGTGLGLALVKDSIQKHKGRLQVRSSTRRDRHGSVFSIFLPEA